MSEDVRVGVYICHCGINIASVVDVEEVTREAAKLPNVVVARNYVYMCSQPGQSLIREDIRKLGVNRVVVASCSPRMHEPTYQRVLEEEGLNPYFFEMANIREQVSWAHMLDPASATEKAKDLVRMAVARACRLEPIPKKEIPVTRSALVIGGGAAGLRAALDLAEAGFQVYLVERQPYLGGNVALLNTLYWGKDAAEYVKLVSEKVLGNPRIKVYLNSDICEVTGYVGNFHVKIKKRPTFVDESCNLCGKCEDACPVSLPNPINLCLDSRKAIYIPSGSGLPKNYIIDAEHCTFCGECVKVCEAGAINLNSVPKEAEFDVGAIIVATGFETYNPSGEYGYGVHKDVITQLGLERLLSRNGPTKGELRRPSDGEVPKSVVFIMCVGSRQKSGKEGKTNAYCSRYCCSSALKNSKIIKENYPNSEVYVLYRDIRAFSRMHEELYRKCRDLGVNFIRFSQDEPPKVDVKDGEQIVTVKDKVLNVTLEIAADLVVLVEGMVPRSDVENLRSLLSLTLSPDGFFQEMHPKMNPLESFTEGIFLAGAAQGPKDIIDSVSQASGAAAKVSTLLSKGRILRDLVTAEVNEESCVGCGKCIEVCPFGAIELDEEREVVRVVDVKCKGCGSCSSKCPIGAIQLRHYRDTQLIAMLDSLVTIHGGV